MVCEDCSSIFIPSRVRRLHPGTPNLGILTHWGDQPLRVMLCGGFDRIITQAALTQPTRHQRFTIGIQRTVLCDVTGTIFGGGRREQDQHPMFNSGLISVVLELKETA